MLREGCALGVGHDVSTVASLRKRIGYAATSLKIVGFMSAIAIAIFVSSLYTEAELEVVIVCVLLTTGCAFQIAKRLRSGSTSAFALAAAWWVSWVGFAVFDVLLKTHSLNFHSVLGLAIVFVPTYFLAHGLFVFIAYRAHQPSDQHTSDPLALHPWEEGLRIKKRPKLLTKKSITAYGFIALFLFILLLLSSVYIKELYDPGSDVDISDWGERLGYGLGWILVVLVVLWGATGIYRRARRAAMLPGSALVKKDGRPIVLYLRSFHDDSEIKLSARASNGRILLERLVKISFEELITDHLWGYGPVLAIGDPQTKHKSAPLGAARDYFTESSWREKVVELMKQASMIVAIAGGTQGLAWEIDTIARLGLVSKFVLLLPPVDMQELKARWGYLASNTTSIVLPSEIDLVRARAVIFPKGSAVLILGDKRDDWTYEAVLDETALVIMKMVAAPLIRVTIGCPRCSRQLRLPAGRSGRVRCPSCGTSFEANTRSS